MKNTPDVPVQPDDVIAGKYRVEKILGAGGMGAVVAAVHTDLDQPVAIKFMLEGGAEDEVAKKRFLREAQAASKLKSPHVTRVYDVGSLPGGEPYLVMERLVGTDLDEIIKRTGKLAIEETCEMAMQACEALAEAHGRGIVHRDIKPANLFVTRNVDGSPHVKVLDFGIAKHRDLSLNATALTQSTALLGSPMFMSLEQFQSAHDVDARSDIFSLGVVLYKALTGTMPFASDSIAGLIMMLMTTEPEPAASRREDLPAALNDVVMRCLQRTPEERFQNVAELAAALAPFAPPRAALLLDRIRAHLAVTPAAENAPAAQAPREPTDKREITSPSGARSAISAPSGSTTLPVNDPSPPTLTKAPAPAPIAKTSDTWTENDAKTDRSRLRLVALVVGALVLGIGGTVLFLHGRGANVAVTPPADRVSSEAPTSAAPNPASSSVVVLPAASLPLATSAPSVAAVPVATAEVAKAPEPVKAATPRASAKSAVSAAPAPSLVPDFGGRK